MPNRPNSVNLVAWGASLLLLTPLVVLCVLYLDVPLAYFVKNHLYGNLHWSRLTSDLPDLLLFVVLLTTSVSLVLYQVRTHRGGSPI